jgi:PAS domain S-box-containing protein
MLPHNGDPAQAVNEGGGVAPASDADFRRMVEEISDYAIFLLDELGRIRTWNAGAQRFKGYAADEVIGEHFRIFYPQALQDQQWPEYELKVAREVGRFEDEGWRVRKDGSLFWANIVITRLLDESGMPRGFSKVTRDLSERRRHEEMLRNSEERFRLLVEGVQDYAIFLLDPDGRVASWNSGAQRSKGYLPDDVIGKHFSIFYPPELVESRWPDQELAKALDTGRFEDEGWRMRKDGSRFWAHVIITALRDSQGRHIGFAKVTRDLSDKRRISSLEDEGRRIATFLAMLGHELRNPLAPIVNALAILDSGKAQAEHLQLARSVISRQVAQMTRLVDDLLDVGRITSGKITLELHPVDLAGVVADAVEAIEPLARAKGHQVRVEGLDCDAWANADRARIIQVVGNLLANAVKFTPPGGLITVTLRRSRERVEISIRDSGIGIAEHMLTDIFRPFVQGDQDVARSQGGLGLGLSLVQQIMQLHGGDVAAFSTTLNSQGSEFVVGLPAIAAVPDSAAADASTPNVPRDLLLVDDNQDAAHTLRIALEMLGYRVTVAHDGLTALAAAERHKPDAMLLDLGLPGLSGIEVAKRIRAAEGHQPRLVALTGYGTDEDRSATAEAGFDAHLTKPVSVDELIRLIECLLGTADGSQASRPT